jgi:hypothetical protein
MPFSATDQTKPGLITNKSSLSKCLARSDSPLDSDSVGLSGPKQIGLFLGLGLSGPKQIGPSGSADQWISGGRRSHGGAEARRKQREESTARHKGNWRVPCSCLCVETPVVAHRCFTLPRSSILCGCINVPGRQVNAVWGRCPTACTMYEKKKLGVCWRLGCASRLRVEELGCAFELRNSGVPLRLRV